MPTTFTAVTISTAPVPTTVISTILNMNTILMLMTVVANVTIFVILDYYSFYFVLITRSRDSTGSRV